ncbi:hypothetical protein AB0P12_21680 [Streptomyces subrutilus]|uniref:hypothetical protein n=1 Tax=Streptomyces subrutilus TaxID=36818 RepID=UPI0033DEA4B4
MHGPGLPPHHGHQPSSGGVVTLRVLFALLPVLSCGFLAWGSMLRLALVTRRPRDWWMLLVTGVLAVAAMTLIQLDPTPETDGWQGSLGAATSILTGFAVCVYFLVFDIRHHEAGAARGAVWYPAQPAPYLTHPTAQQGYGYPQSQPPQLPPQPPHATPVAHTAPHAAPPPHATPPPRLGQVRAELDELSELLRRQQPHDGDTTR